MLDWYVNATAIQLNPTVKCPMPKTQPRIQAWRQDSACRTRSIAKAMPMNASGQRLSGSNASDDAPPASSSGA
jgi:hypothetical protein